MRNFVKQLPQFREMSSLVGNRGDPASAPAAESIDLFHQIASDARSTEMIMAIELEPKAVVSLIHPLKETKTLKNGQVVTQVASP
ncbi:hypothetical protein T484DRAFT_1840097 [Baffinella frigidus]|nr:hypothetical protein T484DRAFT_1840097 [Cryptophyta sp. CCMP2293]